MNLFSFKRLNTTLLSIFICMEVLILGCSNTEKSDPVYLQEVEAWHARRITSLKKSDGWLSLRGLFWLKEGKNSFGASEQNRIKFPPEMTPEEMGWFILQENSVSVEIKDGIPVYFNDHEISRMTLKDDSEGEPDILRYRSLSWHIIKRGDRYGVRLKDSESKLLRNFTGIERFPVDPAWRVTATFQAYDSPKVIEVPNILGTISEDPSPGKLIFTIKGQSYSLDPIADPEDKRWFIIFLMQPAVKKHTAPAGFYTLMHQQRTIQLLLILINPIIRPALSPPTPPVPYPRNRIISTCGWRLVRKIFRVINTDNFPSAYYLERTGHESAPSEIRNTFPRKPYSSIQSAFFQEWLNLRVPSTKTAVQHHRIFTATGRQNIFPIRLCDFLIK